LVKDETIKGKVLSRGGGRSEPGEIRCMEGRRKGEWNEEDKKERERLKM
jgi:hypothetical protein